MHFIHININSLLPKIDEVCYIVDITNASIIEVNGYDLVRFDWSRRVGGVACYIKSSIVYNYKDSFCSNTESIFVNIFFD